jgi:hypothetical protein
MAVGMRVVAMIVLVIMIMFMVMPAAAIRAMRMVVMVVVMMGVIMMRMVMMGVIMMGMIMMGMAMMLVVIMLVMMAVIVPVMRMTVVMIMMSVIMVRMIMMSVAALQIGAAFRIERRLDGPQLAAQPLDHRLDHMVPANAQPAIGDLHREMAVAEMPGEAQQVIGAVDADFHQRFRCAHHLHQPAIIEPDGITRAKRDRFRQVEQESEAAHALHRNPAAMPVIIIQHDCIGGGSGPIALGNHSFGTDHPVAPRWLISV